MAVPLIDVKAQYAPLLPELKERIEAVLEDGRFILGPNVQAFEQEAAAYLGVEHTVGVANGTDALLLVLEAMGIGPGDEVICPAFTFYATAESIARRGATPVFADIDPETLNLDPGDVAGRISKRTRAIMPVHLFGRPAPVAELSELGPPLIEDAAQSFGAPGIATSPASTFSFYPTKNLFGLGDGGLVATPDAEIADRVRMLRFHGSRDKADFHFVGCNSRLDEIQAAALRLFLEQLDGWSRARREAAERYRELGLGESVDTPADEPGHVYHLFVSRSPERDAIIEALQEQGIASAAVLPHRAPPPAGASLPRLHRGLVARDRARLRGEFRRPALAGNPCGRAGTGGRGSESGGRREDNVVIPSRHRAWQLVADAALVAGAWYLAFQLRFDSGVPVFYETLFERTILIVVGIKLLVFILFGFYNHWWRYVSTRDMWRIVRGVTVACLVADLTVYLINPVGPVRLPRSIAATDWLLTLALVAGARLLVRSIMERPSPRGIVARGKEVLVVGAGDAAQLIVREMLKSPALGYTPIGLVDDDPRKKNLRLHGVRVLGTTADLPRLLRDSKPDEVLIAIPSAGGDVRQGIVNVASDAGVSVKTLPGIYELIAGDRDLAAQIRPVQVEDVLGREPVEVDLEAVASYLGGETVLVTGAGGSIGAELCRQIAHLGAARLVLVDHAEPALFEIERELVGERGFPASIPVLADVKNEAKMRQVFERYQPKVVFHAAAYKHVPLMEANPVESVRNNVLGTKAIAQVAVEFGAERFVLVSTDKALNPRAVYGQCKTICEWVVEAYGHRPDIPTRFVAVRFGNVLGSSGSVISIFRRQIEKGGPVTVTHPEMTRYFMTTPEAVALVVQAGGIGGRGEIFVLDMGEPVRIVELAQNMIRLSGKEPAKDIAIEFIGVRPGEKMHEELIGEGESAEPTSHAKILRVTRPTVNAAWLEEQIPLLERLVEEGDTLELVSLLSSMMQAPQRSASRVSTA